MRLFELDLGSARGILRLLQRKANAPGPSGRGQPLTIPFPAMIHNFHLDQLTSTF